VTDLFLGVIAVSVLVMAVIQVAGIVMAARVARRVDGVADRVEQGVDKVFASVHGMTQDAARAASVFSGILGMFRKARPNDGKDPGAGAGPDDTMFVG
jgi:hypothetical protein